MCKQVTYRVSIDCRHCMGSFRKHEAVRTPCPKGIKKGGFGKCGKTDINQDGDPRDVHNTRVCERLAIEKKEEETRQKKEKKKDEKKKDEEKDKKKDGRKDEKKEDEKEKKTCEHKEASAEETAWNEKIARQRMGT